LRDGNAAIDEYFTGGTPASAKYTWKNAGMQNLLNAVRATGAMNVVLAGPLGYAQLLDGWLEWKPTDPAGQLGATWHAYPPQRFSTEVGCGVRPDCSATMMNAAKSILAAGFPVIITEFGDYIGGSSAPMVSILLPFADANGLSYFGWTWDLWLDQSAFVLIKDAVGTPSAGFGTYVKLHYLCKSAGESNCL
jgi:endoglucanase